MFCVRQSSVRGCRFFQLCLFILLLKCIKCSPVPASFFPYLLTSLHWCPKPGRKEGHAVREPSLLRGIAVLRRSGSRKKRRPPVAARSGGAGAMEEQVGRKTRCRAPGSRRGGCRPRGSGGVGPVHLEAEACCHPPCLGRSRERGTRCGCPRPEEPSPSARRRRSIGPSHQRGPVPSHGTASEPLSCWLRTERQCVREPDRDFIFIFPLSPLSSLSLLILPSPFSRLVCPYPQERPRPPLRAPPGRGGRGGRVERSLVGTPRPARSDGGMWRVGRGREPCGTERGRWSNW